MGLRERSVMVLSLMFGLLFAVLMVFVEIYGLGIGFAVGGALVIILLQWYLGPVFLKWVYHIRWVGLEGIDPELAEFIKRTCEEQGMPVPAIGIIEDGNPNAFVFGRHKGDAHLVVTRGLLDMLNEKEITAVVAHELGHIAHNDFVVMMIASTIPIILYIIFRHSLYMARGRGDSRENRGAPYFLAIAAVSYIVYVLSQYLALFLSRVREYYADDFSAEQTHNPDALASALIKISYGLVGTEDDAGSFRIEAGRALGLADHTYARALAASAKGVGAVSWMDALKAMRWDLVNPWGRYYELFSTHPLTARRVKAMEEAAKERGMGSSYDFDYFESLDNLSSSSFSDRWSRFLYEIAVGQLHVICLIGIPAAIVYGSLVPPMGLLKLAVLGFALGYLVKTRLSYPDGFDPASVEDLVYDESASPVLGRPVTVKGRIIGRGIPGYVASEDLVLQDSTGFIFLDYHQPFHMLDFLFGLGRANAFVDKKVTVTGWYRRAPQPYIELLKIEGARDSANVYTYTGRMITGAIIALIALVVL